jgi:type IV pilus assembly protein PilV
MMRTNPSKVRVEQRGFSLIEVLVTMLVVALGLLGAAGTQLAATRYQQTAGFRNQAFTEAQYIIERMKVNSAALTAAAPIAPVNTYLLTDTYDNAGNAPGDPACGLNAQPLCTASQAAQRDMREWRLSLARNLPAGRGSVFTISSGGITDPAMRRVVVMWIEKRDSSTDDAELAAPTDATCPAPQTAGVRCLSLVVTP